MTVLTGWLAIGFDKARIEILSILELRASKGAGMGQLVRGQVSAAASSFGPFSTLFLPLNIDSKGRRRQEESEDQMEQMALLLPGADGKIFYDCESPLICRHTL